MNKIKLITKHISFNCILILLYVFLSSSDQVGLDEITTWKDFSEGVFYLSVFIGIIWVIGQIKDNFKMEVPLKKEENKTFEQARKSSERIQDKMSTPTTAESEKEKQKEKERKLEQARKSQERLRAMMSTPTTAESEKEKQKEKERKLEQARKSRERIQILLSSPAMAELETNENPF